MIKLEFNQVITVPVTAEDIVLGVKRHTCFCPIARAINRLLEVDDIRVCHTFATRYNKEPTLTLKLDAVDRTKQFNFIENFDSDKPVQPNTFQFKVVTSISSLEL